MSLRAGSTLGSYEIVGAIGAGGMGEVYRARDANLNRDVAIKVLPAAMAGDPERLGRFKREAQVLASLNHPNIAHVYGFESAAFVDGSKAHFLAMEMVAVDRNDDDARAVFEQNAAQHPDEPYWTQLGLARAYIAKGDKARAIRAWEAALAHIPDYDKDSRPQYERALKGLKSDS